MIFRQLVSYNLVVPPSRRSHVLCRSTMLCCVSISQRRSIISYLRAFFGYGTPSTGGNPILEIIKQRQEPQSMDEAVTDSSLPKILLPKFSAMRPSHMTEAAAYVRDQQLQDLQRTMKLLSSTEIPSTPVGTDANNSLHELPKIDCLIQSIDRIQQSHFTLRQTGSLLWTLSSVDMRIKDDWHHSLIHVQNSSIETSILPPKSSDDNGDVIDTGERFSAAVALQWGQLHKALFTTLQLQQLGNSKSSKVYAANLLLRKYEYATGTLFHPPTSTIGGSSSSAEEQTRKYSELSEILADIEKSILDIDSPQVSLSTVSYIYNYIGVRTQMANMLSYPTVMDQVFHCRYNVSATADVNVVKQLHLDVKERLKPMFNTISEKRKRPLDLEKYLTGANEFVSKSNQNKSNKYAVQHWKDVRAMLKLEDHVTLKGALQFTFKLIKDLFGVLIVEHVKNDLDVWDKHVRLYHVYDELNENVYLGSFFLDPFHRHEKMSQAATIPIFPRGEYEHQCPLVCMSLGLDLPPWDTSPAMMTWLDCESLLHEMGHMLQFLMSRAEAGCLLGPQNMPLDISELLPKFMELWLTQRSSLFALIDMSESETPLSEASIDATYRVKSREKMLKLAELNFYGSLELELFSGFDLKGSESILELQERFLEDTMPHIDNDENYLMALIDLMKENANGRQVAYYRYLWCEVIAAAIFERIMGIMVSDPQLFPQLRLVLRHHLLAQGAAVDFDSFRSKFGLNEYSLDALWKLHGIASVLYVASPEA